MNQAADVFDNGDVEIVLKLEKTEELLVHL